MATSFISVSFQEIERSPGTCCQELTREESPGKINTRSFTSLKKKKVLKSEVYAEAKQMKTTTEVKNVLLNNNKERSTLLLFELLVKLICLLWYRSYVYVS